MTRPIHFQTSEERHIELIPWSDADLVQMSQISQQDQQRADAYWRRLLPRRLRNLLAARSQLGQG